MNLSGFTIGIGFVIALLVLLLAVVFWATGQLAPEVAGLIGALAIARMVP